MTTIEKETLKVTNGYMNPTNKIAAVVSRVCLAAGSTEHHRHSNNLIFLTQQAHTPSLQLLLLYVTSTVTTVTNVIVSVTNTVTSVTNIATSTVTSVTNYVKIDVYAPNMQQISHVTKSRDCVCSQKFRIITSTIKTSISPLYTPKLTISLFRVFTVLKKLTCR